jgi:gliding motility-associated-like protein
MDTLCAGGANSHFGVPYQSEVDFHWLVNGGQIMGRQDTNIIEVQWSPAPGIYEVIAYVTHPNGCPGDTSRYYIQIKNPAFANAKAPTDVCEGAYVTIESALADNFMWGGGQTSRSIGFMAEEDTVISLIAINDPCPNDTMRYFITVHEQPTAGMNYLQDTVLISTSEVVYHTGSPNPAQIEWWHNGRFISDRPAVEIEFDQQGYHELVQVVKQGMCYDTIRQMVYVEDILKVFIPNAFTPNGDGINDYFRFEGVGIKSFEAEIFNRWGERIFSWSSESNVPGWDGTNSGQDSKMDAYIYRIRVIDMRDQSHFYTDQCRLGR